MAAKLAITAALALAASGAQAAALDTRVAALAVQVDQLESVRAIKKLQRAFGYYVDRGLWDEAADLFADSGTVEIGADGVYVGRQRIRDYLQQLGGGQPGLAYGQLNEWLQLQPVVTLGAGGDSATARWRDLGMLGQFRKSAAWRDGIYENAYVREGGIWKLKALHLFVNFTAPYEQGWARLKEGAGTAASEAAQAMPPDRPPTARAVAFPQVQVPPFSYPNPVTGRRWGARP